MWLAAGRLLGAPWSCEGRFEPVGLSESEARTQNSAERGEQPAKLDCSATRPGS
jgi:hypothetical protein